MQSFQSADTSFKRQHLGGPKGARLIRVHQYFIECFMQYTVTTRNCSILHSILHLSFIDLERGGFGEILPEVLIFPSGQSPEGNINTSGNISPNPPSGRSINDILYRKLKASKLRIKNLTHTFVNTMFYFRINASIVAFLSNHISFGILMTTFFKICFKILKKPQLLHHLPGLFIAHQYYLYFVGHVVVMRVVSRGLRE
jgi:hypothetical protein